MFHNKNILIGIAVGIVLGLLGSYGISEAEGTAGTSTDPLVTVGYMNLKLAEMDKKYTDEIASLKKQIESVETSSTSALFEIKNLPKGAKVYFGASTEFIVRVGRTVVVDPNGIGIPDLTSGLSVLNEKEITLDHHMLVPSNDGRGIQILEDCWIMIKGPYSVITN